MSLFKPLFGKRSNLDSKEKVDGYIYFCKDDSSLHVDYIDDNGDLQRSQVNAKNADSLSGALLSETLVKSDIEVPTSNAVATTYVDTEIANLVNSAPETLDTLGELATAFQENDDVVSVLNDAIATKYSADNPPPYPVTSVQGKTGAVTFTAETWTFTLSDGSTVTKKVLLE